MKGLLFFAALLLFPSASPAEVLNGKVVWIVDGDTLHIEDVTGVRHKVRLSGINAPERKQAYGQRAKQYLTSLVYGVWVRVYWDKLDKYDRVVGKIISGGKDVSLAMVRAGYARWYRRFAHEQSKVDRVLYQFAEKAAKREKLGIWLMKR